MVKQIRRTQMEIFEGRSLAELKEDFNRKMDWLGREGKKLSTPEINLEKLNGCVLYEEEWKQPESLKDYIDLSRLSVSCGQCSKFETTKYSYGKCDYCKGELRKADYPCERFWKEWERGTPFLSDEEREIFEDVENEFRASRLRCIEGRQVG